MFSGMMRRPAGLVQKAFRKTFRPSALAAAVEPVPRYWPARYSHPGFLLKTPDAAAPGEKSAETGPGPSSFERHLLPKQRGRAASFLGEAR